MCFLFIENNMNTKNLFNHRYVCRVVSFLQGSRAARTCFAGSDAGADQMAENGELCIRAFRVEHIQ